MKSRRAEPGEVQTVLGPLAPEALGLVLPHEHILCDVTPPEVATESGSMMEIVPENAHEARYYWTRPYGNHILSDRRILTSELSRFRAAGGGAVVELTIRGIKPDPQGLFELSEASGVPIIAGTGYYIQAFAGDFISENSVDEMAVTMIRDAAVGFDGTDIRAGIIGEIGVSDPWSAAEQRVMQAAVIAQRETGLPINVHPGRDPGSPLAVARFVRAVGGDPTRLVISHMDRTLFHDDDLVRLMDQGCSAEWDFFGIESSYYPFADIDLPNDGQRLNLIKRLVDRGYSDRILISQDICTKARLVHYGGHGYAHIPRAVLPMMRRKGFSERDINTITRTSPQKLLSRLAAVDQHHTKQSGLEEAGQ
jgi:phosphotriesterase-related protein